MRNLHKRFMALVMTCAMLFACTTMASATYAEDEQLTNSNQNIMPLSIDYLHPSGENLPDGTTQHYNFYMANTQKLGIRLVVSGSCEITVKLHHGITTSTLLHETVTNGEIYKFSKDAIQKGWKVSVDLRFSGSSSSYVLMVAGI